MTSLAAIHGGAADIYEKRCEGNKQHGTPVKDRLELSCFWDKKNVRFGCKVR